VPTFNDKGWSARRRTFIVPFAQRFASNPNFEEVTFTQELFEALVGEMCRYAVRLRDQGLRYKWSAATLAAKAEYDVEANNAEEYAREIIQQGIVGFETFGPIKMDYENWCIDQGYVPLGISNLRRAIQASGFERRSAQVEGKISKLYMIPNVKPTELQTVGMSRPGMYTLPGFTPPVKPPVPDFDAPDEPEAEQPRTNVKGKWFE
jgi:phage/plasmid-associated DNA primase